MYEMIGEVNLEVYSKASNGLAYVECMKQRKKTRNEFQALNGMV